MFNLTLLKQNVCTGLASRKHDAGYWVETTLGNASGFNSIEQDPMNTASFYKGSGN